MLHFVMHFFYGIKNNKFRSELTIPLFECRKFYIENNYSVCRCYAKDDRWHYEKINSMRINDKFYFIENEYINNDNFFFLIKDENFNRLSNNELIKFEKFPVRANFKIYLDQGGFSSYQSEYPFGMVGRKGSVTCSVSSLANVDADNNYILFRNIFNKPIKEEFNSYLVNVKSNKKIKEYKLKTNTSNILEIERNHIKPEIYFVTDKYLGIPSFISIKNGHVSLEHTHPPHAYILNSKKFHLVNKLKNKFNEIIN